MFLTNHQPYPASHSKTQARQHLEYKDWDIKFNPRSQSKQTASNTSSSLLLRRFPAKSHPGDVAKHWRLPFRVDRVGPGNNRAANCWGQVTTCQHGMTSPHQLGMIRTGRLHWKSLESPRSPWTNQSIIHRYALNSGKSSSYKMKLFFSAPQNYLRTTVSLAVPLPTVRFHLNTSHSLVRAAFSQLCLSCSSCVRSLAKHGPSCISAAQKPETLKRTRVITDLSGTTHVMSIVKKLHLHQH